MYEISRAVAEHIVAIVIVHHQNECGETGFILFLDWGFPLEIVPIVSVLLSLKSSKSSKSIEYKLNTIENRSVKGSATKLLSENPTEIPQV